MAVDFVVPFICLSCFVITEPIPLDSLDNGTTVDPLAVPVRDRIRALNLTVHVFTNLMGGTQIGIEPSLMDLDCLDSFSVVVVSEANFISVTIEPVYRQNSADPTVPHNTIAELLVRVSINSQTVVHATIRVPSTNVAVVVGSSVKITDAIEISGQNLVNCFVVAVTTDMVRPVVLYVPISTQVR